MIRYTATTDAPTVCNMTNHSYFNLNGHASGTALGHRVSVDADAYLEMDDTSVPHRPPHPPWQARPWISTRKKRWGWTSRPTTRL